MIPFLGTTGMASKPSLHSTTREQFNMDYVSEVPRVPRITSTGTIPPPPPY